MTTTFPHLFSPFMLKGLEIPNRILSTGHDTEMGRDGLPTERLIAYQVARAKGGAGLIVVQVVAVHETARYTPDVLMGTSDACIPHFKALYDAVKAHGTRVFVQLFHPGRELLGRRNGVMQAALAPSSSPAERFRIIPREMSPDEIAEIVEGYGQAARRMAEAGADGVEIVASHGYLPAQFLNPRVNRRTDPYGGTAENRLRFLREVVASVRANTPEPLILGLRFSATEFDSDGVSEEETLEVCRRLRDEFDYFNVIAGTSASASGAVHIVPPMSVKNAYLAPFSQRLKQTIGKPVFVAGRINQPQEAERVLAEGAADMCGMTRAMICDPRMPEKARAGRVDDIRACIACNQACIGHAQLNIPISCIQYPESGRELQFGSRRRSARARRIMVVGGGPAGMKAAAVAAEIGHEVTLYEKEKRLGGQALLAQLLPHRAEFGGIVTNLAREMELTGVRVHLGVEATPELIATEKPDAVLLATGSRPAGPCYEFGEGLQILHGNEVLVGRAATGARVVVYDWLADWRGAGIAEKLAGEGAHVRLAVNGVCAAAAIQSYVRDATIGRLQRLGVEMMPFMRLYGSEGNSVYFLHTASQEAVLLENADTLVLVTPNQPEDALHAPLKSLGIPVRLIGDAVAPRTAEEAVFEGLQATTALCAELEGPTQ
ncbi:FAD-dependent oxidoreductase [Chelativorans sp.]|uniref:oxidoreductase n=1 Tax=Chelativorans sp. TaxID=2203393 RepID=UPI00281118FA|nr:FAD-dependent oxidoreductase [Chelativorans sp.]